LLATMFAACAPTPTKVQVDKDASADFSVCKTFGWLSPQTKSPSTLSEQRIRTEAFAVLKSKGYAIDDSHPDCRVSYRLDVRETPKSKPGVGVGVGGGTGGIGGGIGITLPIGKKKDKQTGTLTLDVLDEARKAQIWSGSLDGNVSGKDLSIDEAHALVKNILEEYPKRK
jgi:hypothetical protein